MPTSLIITRKLKYKNTFDQLHTNSDPGANGTGASAVSGPSTPSPLPCDIGANAHCRTGSLPPCCCVSPVRPDASPENWVSLCGPAIAGAGGCAMRPCPMRCTANCQARWKRMPAIRLPATRDKPSRAGRRRWGTDRVVVVSSARPGGGTTTKTVRRSSPRSAARGRSSSRRPRISRCRRCRRQQTSLAERAVGSIPTRLAAIGR